MVVTLERVRKLTQTVVCLFAKQNMLSSLPTSNLDSLRTMEVVVIKFPPTMER